MNYSNITTCDVCNGLGIGVVLWCQGCDLHCEKCHNPETWDFEKGIPFTERTWKIIETELNKSYITRFTLSGGHPLAKENLKEVTNLCKLIKAKYPDIKIWIYTGYIYEDIKSYEILKYVDILVDGPFIWKQRDITLPFKGSTNQRVIDVQKSLKENKTILYE